MSYERLDAFKLQRANHYFFSMGSLPILAVVLDHTQSGVVIVFSTLAHGAIGGLVSGCLMIAIEKRVQKWSQDRRNKEKLKGLHNQLSQEPEMTEMTNTVQVEFCNLIREEKKIDDIGYAHSYIKAREQELETLIQMLESLTRKFELYVEKLINSWGSISIEERKLLEKYVRNVIEIEVKEADQIKIPNFSWVIKKMKAEMSSLFLSRSHKKKINKLRIKALEARYKLEQARNSIFETILELAEKDYYSTLPEEKILERLEDPDLENWVVSIEPGEIDMEKIKRINEVLGRYDQRIEIPKVSGRNPPESEG